jgi:hypothetical protein
MMARSGWPRCPTTSPSSPPPGPGPHHRHGLRGRQTETDPTACSITLLRPTRKDQAARYGEPLPRTIRQLNKSVNDTLKGPARPASPAGRTFEGVAVRPAQRIPAMATAIWHNNNKTSTPVTRSLIAYDH